MAIACPVDLDTLRLRAEIQSVYARVATDPAGEFHFHRGPAYAVEMLGYDAAALAWLPSESTASSQSLAAPRSWTSGAAPAWTCCSPRARSHPKGAPLAST
jgi:hypothetical protein